MNLTAVLLTGLFAGGLSCTAVQGGLLAGLITRQHTATTDPPVIARRVAGRTRDVGIAKSGTRRRGSVQATPALSWRAQLAEDLVPVGGYLAAS